MLRRIIPIFIIFLGAAFAWFVLGGVMQDRSNKQDSSLKEEVGQLWGSAQRQKAPAVYYQTTIQKEVQVKKDGKDETENRTETINHSVPLEESNIKVGLNVDYRQKGLLWYSTYRVGFNGDYKVVNNTAEDKEFTVNFEFPNKDAVYDNFKFAVGDKELEDMEVVSGSLSTSIKVKPNQVENFKITYDSQGLDEWWYDFGKDVNQVKNFSLVMNTDFKDIDFPRNGISPVEKIETDSGWELKWKYTNLLTGVKIGMLMPKKLNPGPWVSQVSFFAPISLFLFLFMVFILSAMKKIEIHPMNYFFICAAFFSFHLLLAYSVDHISIHISFLICSIVSIFLVVSYMRLVVGQRFAFMEVGISQFIFLIVFSYSFFFKGYTGLTITVLFIITLFVAMQITARVNWFEIFSPKKPEIACGWEGAGSIIKASAADAPAITKENADI
ncbi:MAG: inner membrane CreD family protein [Eubacteriales bacterium]